MADHRPKKIPLGKGVPVHRQFLAVSTGSFLSAGNTTFLTCVDDHRVDEVIDIIRQKSHRRKQFVPNSANFGTTSYASFPVEVSVGGATIFVTNIERFEKV